MIKLELYKKILIIEKNQYNILIVKILGKENLIGCILEVTVEMEKLYFDKWLIINDNGNWPPGNQDVLKFIRF